MERVHISSEGAVYARPRSARRTTIFDRQATLLRGTEIAKGLAYVIGAGLAGGLSLTAIGARSAQGLVVDLLDKPITQALLGVVAVCLAFYSVWRLYVAARERDSDPESILRRAATGAGGFVHLLMALAAAGGLYGAGREDFTPLTAQLLIPRIGVYLAVVLGASLMIAGAIQIYRAVNGSYEDTLELPARSDPDARRLLRFGQIGMIARALALPIIGTFLALTALQAKPYDPIGLASSMELFLARSAGPYLLLFVGLASALYGGAVVAVSKYKKLP